MFLDIFMHGTDVCTRYGVGVSWQRKSLGDMDVIWTELKGCACKTTEECQRSKTMRSESDHSCCCSQTVCGLEFCGKGEML